jgi:hypothetical protein
MRPLPVLILLAAALAGCTHYTPPPGLTPQAAAKDDFECTRDAFAAGGAGNDLAGAVIVGRIKQLCMVGKGWTVR